MNSYEFPPLSEIFPLIEGAEFDDLVADIQAHGIREPIWLYDGKILDGRNRYRAAKSAKADCPVREYIGDDPVSFVISLNLKRRHLDESQRSMVAVKLATMDLWDNEADPAWRREAFGIMERTPNLIYLLLSKRIGNAIKMCDPARGNQTLPRNAALGATMVTQEEWDRDLPKLKQAGWELGAKFTFASVEPMLGPIRADYFPDWVIVGGESGLTPRHMDLAWARSLRDQCAAAGVPFFFKQTTGKGPIPEDLMVRQFPESIHNKSVLAA